MTAPHIAPQPSMVAPLRHRRFLSFWLAAIVSNIGTWMQQIAVPLAVYGATGRATWIGITSMSGLVPSLVATTFSGTIADRFERRRVLFVSQLILTGLAFSLWGVFRDSTPSMLVVCGLVAVSSLVGGVSMTCWQSFVPTLVPRELLAPAVRLNSMQFALGRALGPLLGAVAIRHYGPRIGFLANAVSYVTVLAVLIVMPRIATAASKVREPAMRQIVDGWRYVLAHRSVTYPTINNFFAGFLGFGFVQLVAPIALQRFHRTRADSSWLSVGFGIGGVLGMFIAGAIGERVRRSRIVPVYLSVWALGMVVLAYVPTFFGGIMAMAVIGVGQTLNGSAVNTALQMQVDDAYRGRAISAYMWGIQSGAPLGALAFGASMDHLGARTSLMIGAAGLALFASAAPSLGLRYADAPAPSGPPLLRRWARQPAPNAVEAIGS